MLLMMMIIVVGDFGRLLLLWMMRDFFALFENVGD